MGDGSEAMPADSDIDTLLAGGTPNQERISMEERSDDGTEIHDDTQAKHKLGDREQKEEPQAQEQDAPAIDPALQQLQQVLSKLTPEQRSQLFPQPPVEIVHNGQKMAVPADKQVPLMQMGLNYSEKMRALNVERQQFETAKAQITEAERYYGEIDKVAKANPQWWQHVQAEYAKFRGQAGNATSNPAASNESPEVRAALSEIHDLKAQLQGYLEKSSKEAELKQHQSEDAELDNQITAFSKEHPELDWMTADESGLVLADRIVVHAHKNGINNYRAAARDFLFNDLVARRELKVKEDQAKTIQAKTKAGVVTAKGKPNGLTQPKNYKNRDYADLMNEGYAELG